MRRLILAILLLLSLAPSLFCPGQLLSRKADQGRGRFHSRGFMTAGRVLLLRYMPKYIPGNPEMIVQNMPGAGSVVATNYVYSVAKPDGLTIGFPSNGIYLDQLVGRPEVKFDIRKFTWIGSPVKEPMLFYIRTDAPYKTIYDVKNAKERLSAAPPAPSVQILS